MLRNTNGCSADLWGVLARGMQQLPRKAAKPVDTVGDTRSAILPRRSFLLPTGSNKRHI